MLNKYLNEENFYYNQNKNFTTFHNDYTKINNYYKTYIKNMKEINFLNKKHNSVKRNYFKRILNKRIPKYKASNIAKKWGYQYWDGSRDINYGDIIIRKVIGIKLHTHL